MAGTIYGLGLSQQFDANGNPLSGCLLYLYQAGTSTPVTAYEDYGLTTGLELPFPIEANAAGRLPAFWLADGSYRARLTDAQGNEVFDESSIQALGPSSGTSTGGGVSDDATLQTGDFLWNPVSGVRSGWVRANGRTIGNVSSGGTERANADTEDLFTYLWNNFSDTICPVSGGRGGSAAADFAASKRIGTVDMRGRGPFGLDDMGNSAAGIISGGTTAGASGGSSTHTNTEAEMVPHTHGAGTLLTDDHTHGAGSYTMPDHSHDYTRYGSLGQNFNAGAGDQDDIWRGTSATPSGSASTFAITGTSAGSGTVGLSGATEETGSGTAYSIMNPYRLGTWYIKL